MFLFLTIIALITKTISGHDEVTHYTLKFTSDNFSSQIDKNNHFVMFYAPWCGHCKRLNPTWEQLAEMLNEDESNIRIAKVDCTSDSEVCSEQDITGYPTLKFFKRGSSEGVKFRGTRDLPSLTTFINEQLLSMDDSQNTILSNENLINRNSVIELTEDNFEKQTENGKYFIKFYAPWCGHCQKLAPIWEELASKLGLDEDNEATIAKIDCTQYRTVCNQFDIKGYPTLLWIENGKKIDRYQGQRAVENLEEYVKKMIGNKEENKEMKKNISEEQDFAVENPVVILTNDNFEEEILNGISLIKFFAPWCGHCKRLAPTWEELAKSLMTNKNIKIGKVDCTIETNKPLCTNQEVEGFPTVFIYKNGEKLGEYDGDRSLDDLKEFVLNHVDKHDEL